MIPSVDAEHESNRSTSSSASTAAASAVSSSLSPSISLSTRWSWGSNGSGCLGLGCTDDLYIPRFASDAALWSRGVATRFVQISCGGCHTLAMDDTGGVWSWGENAFNQSGLHSPLDSSSPSSSLDAAVEQTMEPLDTAAIISFPRRIETFPLLRSSSSSAFLSSSPSPSSFSFRCIAVSAGWTHSACIMQHGKETTAYLWGDNRYQQCSTHSYTHSSSSSSTSSSSSSSSPIRSSSSSSTSSSILPFPTPLTSLAHESLVEIRCAWKHTIARTSDGRVFAWGNNAHGQLGVGDLQARNEPTLVLEHTDSPSSSASSPTPLLCSALAVGWKHSLFLSFDRKSLYAAGSNSYGQLGLGLTSAIPANINTAAAKRLAEKVAWPTRIRFPASDPNDSMTSNTNSPSDSLSSLTTNEESIDQIAAGWSHSLVLTSRQQVFGFGRADFGQLAAAAEKQLAHRVKSVTNPTRIMIHSYSTFSASSCTACSPSSSSSSSSSLAQSPSRILSIACGSEHSLIHTEHDLFMCGWNEHGNLGQGHCKSVPFPTDSAGGGGFVSVEQFHRCKKGRVSPSVQRVTNEQRKEQEEELQALAHQLFEASNRLQPKWELQSFKSYGIKVMAEFILTLPLRVLSSSPFDSTALLQQLSAQSYAHLPPTLLSKLTSAVATAASLSTSSSPLLPPSPSDELALHSREQEASECIRLAKAYLKIHNQFQQNWREGNNQIDVIATGGAACIVTTISRP